MPTEREKMLRGDLYNAADPELVAARLHARELLHAFNSSAPTAGDLRAQLLADLFGPSAANVYIEPPFYCDYGANITFGPGVFMNFNCVILDVAPVSIGSGAMFGPSVGVYTATHPLDATTRRSGLEFGKPIQIGDDVWVGGGALILPGVTIGSRTVIGAGSVVTRDLPEGVFAAGNPCRVIRSIG